MATGVHCGPCYKTFFGVIYATIGITLVKTLSKYDDSIINYARLSFIIFTPEANVIKLFVCNLRIFILCKTVRLG
jgi:hypothetical protein